MIYLNEQEFYTVNSENFKSIFKKVAIYNKNNARALNEGINVADIRFNINECAGIQCIGQLMRYHLLEGMIRNNEINENILNEWGLSDIKNGLNNIGNKVKQTASNIKQSASNLWDKIKNWSDEKWDQFMSKIGGKMLNAYKFIKKLIAGTTSSVKQFIEYVYKCFMQISNTVRGAIEKLGGFGDNVITDNDIQQMQKQALNESGTPALKTVANQIQQSCNSQGEYKFITYLAAWIDANKSNKSLQECLDTQFDIVLNENDDPTGSSSDAPNYWRHWLGKHKIMGVILGAQKPNGEKMGFWSTLCVSLAGSILIWCVGFFAGPFGVAGAGTLLAVQILWNARNIFALYVKRKSQLKPGQGFFYKDTSKVKDGQKSLDWLFIISFLVTIGCAAWALYTAVNSFCDALHVSQLNDEYKKLLEEYHKAFEGKEPTPEEATKWFNEHGVENPDEIFTPHSSSSSEIVPGDSANGAMSEMDSQTVIDQFNKGAEGISATPHGSHGTWLQEVQKNVWDNIKDELPAGYDYVGMDIYLKGGLKAAFNNSETHGKFMEWLSSHNLSLEEIGQHSIHSHAANGADTYARILTFPHDKFPGEAAIDELTQILREASPKHIGRALHFGATLGEKIISHETIDYSYIDKTLDVLKQVIAPAIDFTSKNHAYIVFATGNENSNANKEGAYWLLTDVQTEKLTEELINTSLDEAEETGKENDKEKPTEVTVLYGIKLRDKTFREMSDKSVKEVEKMIDNALSGKKTKDVQKKIAYINPVNLTIKTFENGKTFFMKGMTQYVTVKPLFNRDMETRKYINNLFTNIFNTSMAGYVQSHKNGLIKKEGKVWKPVNDATANDKNQNTGNFSVQEICDYCNQSDKSSKAQWVNNIFGSFDSAEATTDNNGNVTSTAHVDDIVNDPNFFEQSVIPELIDTNSDVYKEIYEYAKNNKRFAKLFFVKNDDKITLSQDRLITLKDVLKHSAAAQDKNLYKTQIEKLFNNKSHEINGIKIKDNDWKEIAAMSYIIWKYSYGKMDEPIPVPNQVPTDIVTPNNDGGEAAAAANTEQPVQIYKKWKEGWYKRNILAQVIPSQHIELNYKDSNGKELNHYAESESEDMTKKTRYNYLPDNVKKSREEKDLMKLLLADDIVCALWLAIKVGTKTRDEKWWTGKRYMKILDFMTKNNINHTIDETDKTPEQLEKMAKNIFAIYKALYINDYTSNKKEANVLKIQHIKESVENIYNISFNKKVNFIAKSLRNNLI